MAIMGTFTLPTCHFVKRINETISVAVILYCHVCMYVCVCYMCVVCACICICKVIITLSFEAYYNMSTSKRRFL